MCDNNVKVLVQFINNYEMKLPKSMQDAMYWSFLSFFVFKVKNDNLVAWYIWNLILLHIIKYKLLDILISCLCYGSNNFLAAA